MLLNEYLQLLAKRESKVVLGNKCSNLVLLTIVLTATFISIAFSNGSLIYLEEKMNDPFTNWVNISNEFGAGKFNEMRESLMDTEVQEHYGFSDIQSDNNFAINVFNKDCTSTHYVQCRFFERLNSDLIKKVLDPDNVVASSSISFEDLNENTLGFVMTRDVLYKLGYTEENIPAYINYLAVSTHADTLGVSLFQDKYAAAPMPVLAVVRRLPMNMDMIGSRYWYEQYQNDDTYPFDFNNREYQDHLLYFVEESNGDFKTMVEQILPDSLRENLAIYQEDIPELTSWAKGTVISVYVGDYLPLSVYQSIDKSILSNYTSKGITRVYRYKTSPHPSGLTDYISVNFAKLDSIRSFESYAKDNFNIQIEMSQVNSKENFNAVSVMANILSWAMIVFSIVCILLFIVNMMQSYFQKVKRNLGTFKAFGISTMELISVYVLILSLIVLTSIILALCISYSVEIVLDFARILKDSEYNYLSLGSLKTVWAIVIIISSAVITVTFVMRKMLKQTPGDLIYDRN